MNKHPSSFRDNDGFVFTDNHTLYRQINKSYAEHYAWLMQSGLYHKLIEKKWLIPHEETNILYDVQKHFKTIQPHIVSPITYCYEWSFTMLKDAALCTLKIALQSLAYNMTLKDATPYNIQFHEGKPIFIDTLSFEKFDAKPWIAYRQFCETFLAPLLLMQHVDIRLTGIAKHFINGIPLSIAAKLLPISTWFHVTSLLHVHLPARSANHSGKQNQNKKFSIKDHEHIIRNLYNAIEKLEPNNQKTTWDDYYEKTIIGNTYLEAKKHAVDELLSKVAFNSIIDFGANTGEFSLSNTLRDKKVIACDFDENCIDFLYKKTKLEKRKNILPLCVDISNPSPALGFNNNERTEFHQRIVADMSLALAIIHHLCIGKNASLEMVRDYFMHFSPYLLIEWVDKQDEKVQQLLQNREDIFDDYSQDNFEKIFSEKYEIIKTEKLANYCRTLYLMKLKADKP